MKVKLLYDLTLLQSTCLIFAQPEQFSCEVALDPIDSHRLSSSPQNNFVYSGSVDPAYLASFQPISFDIYFWIINKSDGTNDGVISQEILLQNLKRTNELFNSMGICFVLKGYNYINQSAIYQGASFGSITNYAQNNNHIEPNSFNVYIPYNMSAGNGAAYLHSNLSAVNQAHFLGQWEIVPGNVLAHELAHNFYLRHPWGPANNSITTPEHVTRDPSNPNYNALTTADLIHDTPAMVSFWGEASHFGLTIFDIINVDNCTYTGSLTDQLNVPFELTSADVGNVMSYTYSPCTLAFTPGQGIRIREYISNPANANNLCVLAMRDNYPAVDLYIKDSAEDFGIEPNMATTIFWNTEDIWIRHQNDSSNEHQNPEYDPQNPNYVYVRVRNRGCSASTGNEQLRLYWSKAATSLSWDYHWNSNNTFPNNALVGGEIGTINLPAIASNEEVVVALPWNNLPNPADYSSINQEPWHFCLLSRIISNDDPMAYSETSVLGYNVRFNNNIAQKNVTIVDFEPNTVGSPIGGVVAVGNFYDEPLATTLEFIAENNEIGKKIFEESEVSIKLDSILQAAWVKGGSQGTNIEVRRDKIIVTGDNAKLENIKLSEGEVGTLNLTFNFLTKEITSKEEYSYHIVQQETQTGDVIGGETFKIRKYPRDVFFAETGGDKLTDKNVPITLSAQPINEPAVYNWYDIEGNLIFEGADFTVSVEIGKKYKLEVIALADGYKDYSEVEVNLKPNAITEFFPNPASNLITLNYIINEGNNAYLSVNSLYTGGGTSFNYVLDIAANNIALDVSNYSPGLYSVALVVNGEIEDTETIIKQ